jgi:two-component sensor histidine kinase
MRTKEPSAPGPPDFRAAFDASGRPLLLIAADPPRYTMVAVNRMHALAFNTTPDALVGRGVVDVFGPDPAPDAREFRDAIRESLDHVFSTGEPHQMSIRRYALEWAGGESEERFWSAINSPVCDARRRITHVVSAVSDVTGEVLKRQSEEARALLIREVDHRARNTLAVVQALVRLAHADSVEEFRDVLEGRVAALARAQTALAARRWEGASLGDLVKCELAALADDDRYFVDGPLLMLPAEITQPMSMILNELATNAGKHGALSKPQGRLSVKWSIVSDREFRLLWREDCGTFIPAPRERGFGSHLVRRLTRQVQGDVRVEWGERGVAVDLRVSLSREPPQTQSANAAPVALNEDVPRGA